MENRGYTLIEVMIVIIILTGVTLSLYYVNVAMAKATLQHESMATVRDDGRLALQDMARLLRMARSSTVMGVDDDGNVAPLSSTPVGELQFQAVTDTDGNGVPLNEDYSVGLTPVMFFGLDLEDLNGDGHSDTQLARFDDSGNVVDILTNYVIGEGGVTFQQVNGGIQINLTLYRGPNGSRPQVQMQMNQVVSPRN